MAVTSLTSASGSKSSRRTTGRRVDRRATAGNRRAATSSMAERLVGEVVAPGHAPVLEVDPLEERRHHLAQLVQHQVGVAAGLGQRVRPAAAAAAARSPDRCRRCRRWTATPPAGCRAARRRPWPGWPGGRRSRSRRCSLGNRSRKKSCMRRQQLGVGVEQPVHVADVAGAERRHQHVGIAVVAVAAADAGVVGDVAGRLLEVGHEPAPLEHLGEHVRGLLAGQVDPAELGHRVVAVLEEDPVVELLGPAQPDGGVDGGVAGDVELVDELVEEEPAQALGRSGVAGEQRALDHLGQVDQGEHGAVEVREVPPEDVGLLRGELLGDVDGHGWRE